MLTGDNATTAEAVAAKLALDDVIADVLPDEKAAVVRRLQEEGRVVAMAGDGINDAPRWRKRVSALRWAPGRMSQWRALESRWSVGTFEESRLPGP